VPDADTGVPRGALIHGQEKLRQRGTRLTPTTAGLQELRDVYVSLQLRGDRREALRFVDDLLRDGHSIEDIRQQVIAAAQREIGRLWEQSRIGIAQEHMATAISQLALAQLYRHARPYPARGRKVVVACVEGELHEFPARLVADSLDFAGYDTRFLGADVPTGSLINVLEQEQPDLLALSITMPFHASALRRQVAMVRERMGGRLPIAVGGLACEQLEPIARELGPEILATPANDIVGAVNRLFGT
jgi:MerR family transcriptional regulator, light-induced transcriptional regulator